MSDPVKPSPVPTPHERTAEEILRHMHGYGPQHVCSAPAEAFAHDRHLLGAKLEAIAEPAVSGESAATEQSGESLPQGAKP